jgi:hypothetical protein
VKFSVNASGFTLTATPGATSDGRFRAPVNGIQIVSRASQTPAITWPAPAAIVYGTALDGTQLNATASVAGTFAYTPASGTVLNAGAGQTLSVAFTPTDAANYTAATADVAIAVSTATPVIAWSTPAAITYGTALSGTVERDGECRGYVGVYAGEWHGAERRRGLDAVVAFTPTDAGITPRRLRPWDRGVHGNARSRDTPAAIAYGTALSDAVECDGEWRARLRIRRRVARC